MIFDDIYINCVRYFDMTDEQIDHLTLKNYKLRIKAMQQKRVDVERDIHLQSWTNQQVKATKNTGTAKKPKQESKYNNFKDFFDYEKALANADGRKTKEKVNKKKRMAETAKRVNQGA